MTTRTRLLIGAVVFATALVVFLVIILADAPRAHSSYPPAWTNDAGVANHLCYNRGGVLNVDANSNTAICVDHTALDMQNTPDSWLQSP